MRTNRRRDYRRPSTFGTTLNSKPSCTLPRRSLLVVNWNNFENMPELTWTYGYPLCLAMIAGLCGYVYWRFKRSGWL